MDDIASIAEFLGLVRKLHITYRFTLQADGRDENDAEHSWSVAMACLLLASRIEAELGVKLDVEKMLKMALVHDLAEIITGDTKTWDALARVNKEADERAAMTELLKDLPADLREELMSLWEECEAQETLEAKVVKSIDRSDPVIHRVFAGVGWKNVEGDGNHASVEALDERQMPRHSFSKVLTAIYRYTRDKAVQLGMFPVS